ncbi:hypothetical protein [Paraurantiacibacter namhicola]|uniref:Uncharacterized protein n=1 Tax=Paraurantiacibacter namhicola TaxID=645517 RepID=A0A1C7DAH7_9SPHN|nr:hypothetical protein [Paraurantiacibacter namhicola]ANU08454.1 hypothetical protein A6F65_02168 [Paraurantiacibacter namhicola]
MTARPVMERPPVAVTTEGQPNAVGANGDGLVAHRGAAGKPIKADLSASSDAGGRMPASVAYRGQSGKIWRYKGKRGRVLAMLATMPAGLTQWDTLPWHTRLGGTIHALRRDGLAIDTAREGKFRHARYRLVTVGSLLKQAGNREGGA